MNDELTLLACCMLDENLVDKAVGLDITNECFNDIDLRVLWDGMVDRRKKGLSCDNCWACDYIKTQTGSDYVMEITNAIGNIQHILEFSSAVEVLLRKYRQRNLTTMLTESITELDTGEPVLIADNLIVELGLFRADTTTEPDIDIVGEIRDRLDKKNVVKTGFPKLTWMTKGIERGVLHILGGFTSHGKTQLSLNIALCVASQEQHVTFFSTEMNEVSLTSRLATITSGINPSLASSLTETEKDAFMTDVQSMKDLPIEICKTLSLANIRMSIQKRKSLLYVVDYIQMIHPSSYIDNEVKRLGHIVRELETMSKDYDVCILATSQFHRPYKKDGETQQPTISSYRGSGEIEENCDVALLLYYPYQMASFKKKQEMENNDKDREVELCVSKNRIHGLTGVINLDFNRRTMRFKEV